MRRIIKKNNQKGFTLIELIVVIAVIGILAAIMIPRFGDITNTAKDNAIKAEAKNIMTVIDVAYASHGDIKSDKIVNHDDTQNTLTVTINEKESKFNNVTTWNENNYGKDETLFEVKDDGRQFSVKGNGEISKITPPQSDN